jgi:hypothetical protein
MLAMMESFPAPNGDQNPPVSASRSLEWRSRYDGLVSVAYISGKAVAGISGPWSGKYALTWWERPMPARQLELHDSMDAAKREVEDWALRTRTGGYSLPLPHLIPTTGIEAANTDLPRSTGLFDRMRSMLPSLAPSASEKIERLRRARTLGEPDLSGLHFAALD